MNTIRVFIPHILGFIGGLIWFLIAMQLFKYRTALAIISLPIYGVLFLSILGLLPNACLRASPTQTQDADTAIILGFGYEMRGTEIEPGAANQALLQWALAHRPSDLRTILVQEGVWVAMNEQTLTTSGIERRRIHQHDPNIYVNTLDTAFCAIQQLRDTHTYTVILIAHDLQLQRVAWDFERVAKHTCPECVFIIPAIHDIPYPAQSVHWQTRNAFVYKITELLIARPRDFLSPIPSTCKAPLPSKT